MNITHTEMISLQVPFSNVDEALWTITDLCGSMNIFPVSYKGYEGKGIVLQFLRNPSMAAYLYREQIMEFVEKAKTNLGIGSILIRNKSVRVDREHMPKEIRFAYELEKINDEDAEFFKKMDEDELAGGKALEVFQEDLKRKSAKETRERKIEENAEKRAEAYAGRANAVQDAVISPSTPHQPSMYDQPSMYEVKEDDYLLPGQLVFSI